MSAATASPRTNEAPGIVASMVRYWRLTLLIVLTAAFVTYAVSSFLPKRYSASTTLQLSDPNRDNVFVTTSGFPEDLVRYTKRQATIVRSGTVMAKVAKDTGGGDVRELLRRTSVKADDPGQLVIRARANSAADAQALADATSTAYRQTVRDTAQARVNQSLGVVTTSLVQLQSTIDTVTAQLTVTPGDRLLQDQLNSSLAQRADLAGRTSQLQINAIAFGDGVAFADPASRPTSPAEPQPLRNAGVAALLGLLVAGALAWVRADRHRAADDSTAPAELLDAPLLGSVPDLASDLSTLGDPGSVAAESYQIITGSLEAVFKWGVLLVTSAARSDGKSVSAASIAAAAARDGSRVVLVDGDARASGLSRRLLGPDAPHVKGLVDLAEQRVELAEIGRLLSISKNVSLPFIPAGSTDSDVGSLFRTAGTAQAMQTLREAYDLVIVDCPALLAVADTTSLALHADGILVVVRRGTNISVLESIRKRLELVAAPIIGYIFTRTNQAQEPYLPVAYGPSVPGGNRAPRPASDGVDPAVRHTSNGASASTKRGQHSAGGRRGVQRDGTGRGTGLRGVRAVRRTLTSRPEDEGGR